MNLPNKISILRILLAPVIVASLVYYHPSRDWLRVLAFWIFLVGVLSDAVDGFFARLQRQQTELGTILDPIADKTLILSTLISCAVIEGLPPGMRIPAWFNLIVISRDVLLVAGTIVLFVITGRWSVHPSMAGKATTGLQMLVICAVLLGSPPAVTTPLLIAGAVLTTLSAITYVRMGIRALG